LAPSQRSRAPWLWAAGGVAFLAAAAGAFYVAWPLLNPHVVATAPLDPACDLRQGPCTSTLPSGATVRFGLEPRFIPLLEPVRIDVEVLGLNALGVEVDFAGVDMNMGYNRPTLAARGDGRFAGEVTIPVCVRNRMEWEAKVLIRTSAGLMAAPYRFWTVRK
jgi:hypothetical protein